MRHEMKFQSVEIIFSYIISNVVYKLCISYTLKKFSLVIHEQVTNQLKLHLKYKKYNILVLFKFRKQINLNNSIFFHVIKANMKNIDNFIFGYHSKYLKKNEK